MLTLTPTSVDARRTAADILVVGVSNSRTVIRTRRLLRGYGVKLESTINGVGRYSVTDAVMTELRRRYSIAADF